MRVQQFLEHHGIARNPFSEEDAQTDLVFKEHCITSTFHPAWDKVYGDPSEPATAIVFGEKGSGKTAMRLQVVQHLEQYNRSHPQARLFVIEYDDFNPFLDRFCARLPSRRRRAERALAEWKLWDHMDAILCLGVTGLVDRLLEVSQPSSSVRAELNPAQVQRLDRFQARDLLLLTACYDQSVAETFPLRWGRLRQRLRFSTWRAYLDLFGAITWTLGWVAAILVLLVQGKLELLSPLWLYLLIAVGGWLPRGWRTLRRWQLARSILKCMRVGIRETSQLRRALQEFTNSELAGQPLPNRVRTDDRYELLVKFQSILRSLGFTGIVVLVDRVDEPHLINGSAELMRALLWPMLDNKFLKHPGLGTKLMLPVELTRFIEREERDFYQRARLDKQNMIASFQWTGEALFDVANARLAACAANGSVPKIRSLIHPHLSDQRLLDAFRSLRVPRRLFKFLYSLLIAHCNAHSDESPSWTISPETFEATLAIQLREQEAFDRGLGAG